MSLFQASGFGATSAPATGGLFGSAPPATSTPGLFGASQPAASAPSLFGASQPTALGPAASAPATTTPSLFGASQPAATTTPLFGATQPAAAASGPATTATTTPSLFGASQLATSTPSLFGAKTTPSIATITATTPAAAATTSAPAATSLFSTTTSTLTPSSTSTTAASLFATAPSTLSSSSLFGSTSAAASTALANAAGRSTLASTTTTAPAVTLTPDTIAGSTKYTELPADAKNTLDQFHSFLQGQIHLSATLSARPSESLDKISKDTEELSKRLATLNDALDRDTKVVQALQDKVGQELKQADSAGRIIEAYANTSHASFLYAGNNSAGQYFLDKCQSFEEQLRQFRSAIEEIERHLASIGTKNPHVTHALPEVMRNQHEGFLAVAARVAALHDEIKDKEKAYIMFRRKYYDDDSDPFQTSVKVRKTDSLRSSGRVKETPKSFREIAKETLRPGSVSTGAAAVAAAPAINAPSTNLFSAPVASTAAPFGGFKFSK